MWAFVAAGRASLTRPEPAATLDAFSQRVRPGGPGWAPVTTRLDQLDRGGGGGLRLPLRHRPIVFGGTLSGLALLALGVLAFAWIGRNLAREETPPLPAVPEPAEREVPVLAAR